MLFSHDLLASSVCFIFVCFSRFLGLTKQHVSDYDSIEVLMEQGNRLRFVHLDGSSSLYKWDMKINKYMLFAGWEVHIVKNCDRGLENAARGRRPRAAFSRPRSQFFTIQTDPKPVNNLLLFFLRTKNCFNFCKHKDKISQKRYHGP